jgi:eukaryotic-like serine/threonine-protein kinase
LNSLLNTLNGLVPEHHAGIVRIHPRFGSEPELLRELVRRRWITPFQAHWLSRGYGSRLFVGPYLLTGWIGTGGMGQVFLARHRELGRFAAVKIVREDRRDDARARARFLREVWALGRLDHANVVHAYDAGTVGRSVYLAMEYVPGPDLGRVLASGEPLASARACEYARQAALGIHHLHEHGLVHRDIKPGNLSLTHGGRVLKVLDVGLVKDRSGTDPDPGLTRAGVLVGTPDYAAPEQVADPLNTARPADQYALGCTLYHMLSGTVPYPGGSPVARALRRMYEDPTPLAELRPELSAGLCAVVSRLLARSPEDRFPSAEAAASALAPFATPLGAAPDDTAINHQTLSGVPRLSLNDDIGTTGDPLRPTFDEDQVTRE